MTKKYTIKQIADLALVSKTAIRKLLTDEFRAQYTETDGSIIQVSEDGANVILAHFNKTTETNRKQAESGNQKPETDTGNQSETSENSAGTNNKQAETVSGNQDELVSVLKDQLENRNHELEEMRKLLSQSQELLLNTQNENRKLLALQLPETKKETVVETPQEPAPKQEREQKPETETVVQTQSRFKKKKRWWQR